MCNQRMPEDSKLLHRALLCVWAKGKVFLPNLTKITSQKFLFECPNCPHYTSSGLFSSLIKTPDSLQTGPSLIALLLMSSCQVCVMYHLVFHWQ